MLTSSIMGEEAPRHDPQNHKSEGGMQMKFAKYRRSHSDALGNFTFYDLS